MKLYRVAWIYIQPSRWRNSTLFNHVNGWIPSYSCSNTCAGTVQDMKFRHWNTHTQDRYTSSPCMHESYDVGEINKTKQPCTHPKLMLILHTLLWQFCIKYMGGDHQVTAAFDLQIYLQFHILAVMLHYVSKARCSYTAEYGSWRVCFSTKMKPNSSQLYTRIQLSDFPFSQANI